MTILGLHIHIYIHINTVSTIRMTGGGEISLELMVMTVVWIHIDITMMRGECHIYHRNASECHKSLHSDSLTFFSFGVSFPK